MRQVSVDLGRTPRAVALCRCSTEEESQKDALIQQVKEAKECIANNGWQLVDLYVEAKSGTSTKGRLEYNRLFEDLCTDKFDIIVVKSQDRLMRNVKDWYLFLDRMVSNGKKLFFYIENKFYSSDDALITGIKAILAEEYSRELSKKINNAHFHRQKEGKVFLLGNTFGYRKIGEGVYEIDEEQAVVVRKVFQYVASGYGAYRTAKFLNRDGYRTGTGKLFTPEKIRRIIVNKTYIGTIVQNKRHYDFDMKKTINCPEESWVIHENAIPAIIDVETFDKANTTLIVNKKSFKAKKSSSTRYDFSGKLTCGLCGKKYYRKTRKLVDGHQDEWACSTYITLGRIEETGHSPKNKKIDPRHGCDNVIMNEAKLYKLLQDFARDYFSDISKEEISNTILDAMKQVLSDNDGIKQKMLKLKDEIVKLEKNKDILLDKLLDGIITDNDFKSKSADIQERLDKAEQEYKTYELNISETEQVNKRIEQLQSKLDSYVIDTAKVSSIVEYIPEIVVYPEKLVVKLDLLRYCDLDIDIEDKDAVIELPVVDCLSNNKGDFLADLECILRYFEDNPSNTVKQMQADFGWSNGKTKPRLDVLKNEGKIYCTSRNGRGRWVVVREPKI